MKPAFWLPASDAAIWTRRCGPGPLLGNGHRLDAVAMIALDSRLIGARRNQAIRGLGIACVIA
jgi:hypothetical protein